MMRRIFHHHSLWEDAAAGMWRNVSGDERAHLLIRVKTFMQNTARFHRAMRRVIREWHYACEVNLSTRSFNRQAWLGHAACVLITTAPEDVTRQAWWMLTQRQRDVADKAAAETILEWEAAQHGGTRKAG
jgi:hypothetical protein